LSATVGSPRATLGAARRRTKTLWARTRPAGGWGVTCTTEWQYLYFDLRPLMLRDDDAPSQIYVFVFEIPPFIHKRKPMACRSGVDS
jgi:hypothetical protein